MLDLGALEEAQPPVHAIRHGGIEQRGFHHAALGVAAIEDRDLVPRHVLAHELARLLHQPLRLGHVGRRLVHAHRLAGPWSVRRFLPRRFLLWLINSFAESRMLLKLR
jgi:hypothetical protein